MMRQFLLGAIAMGWWVAGLYFLRFWRETRDRLFLAFAAAFWTLALTRVGLALIDDASESETTLYWLRFLAFALILLAIVDKNRNLVRGLRKR